MLTTKTIKIHQAVEGFPIKSFPVILLPRDPSESEAKLNRKSNFNDEVYKCFHPINVRTGTNSSMFQIFCPIEIWPMLQTFQYRNWKIWNENFKMHTFNF